MCKTVRYPLTKVIGIDISPHQPTQIKPNNFEFINANVQERLPFDDNTFDFPDGFLELCESSLQFDAGPATLRIWNAGEEILMEKGGDLNVYQKLDQFLQNQGRLENINKEVKKAYFSVKHNNIEFSKAFINDMVSITNSLKPFLTKKLQISDENFDELAKTSEKELVELDTYIYWVRAYASKVIDNNN
ncbi:hypothetical protein C2G38_2242874 [Gigaspora rosea]|uniref:Methyltransferase type 11 domain-containing protein n=1 Tax=Gigaspora rosea TaxID=44941 RepID=A0A397VKV7_9GLOM|nr:hypothetical protein C2G38_2242874 [Gigaspora rosea]